MRVTTSVFATVALLGSPLAAAALPRSEARAVFDPPVEVGTSVAATAPIAATKGTVLFEQAYRVSQKTRAIAANTQAEGIRHHALPAGTAFAAWSFGGEVRLCRTERSRGVVAKADMFVCLRDLDGDGRAEQTAIWSMSSGETTEAAMAPAPLVTAAPSRHEMGVYLDGHVYRFANRLRVAGVSKTRVKLVWEVANARPKDADEPHGWPVTKQEAVEVEAGAAPTIAVIGPWSVAATLGADGRPRVHIATTAAWLSVTDGGREVLVNGERFDRVFNWPTARCEGSGNGVLAALTSGGMLQRRLIKTVGGCDAAGPLIFAEWERPKL